MPFVPHVGYGGRGIAVLSLGGDGTPSPVVSLMPPDDIQVIAPRGVPAGGAFTLSFNGGTTTPFAVTDTPPATSATWTFAGLTPGTPYYVRVAFRFPQGGWSHGALVEVFDSDGTTRLQDATFDLTADNDPYCDYLATNFGGQYGNPHLAADGSLFRAVAKDSPTGYAAAPVSPGGTSLSVRLTGPADQVITLNYVMCSPVAPSGLTMSAGQGRQYYSDEHERAAYYQAISDAALAGNWIDYDVPRALAVGDGAGDAYAIAGGAAAVRAALLAMTIASGQSQQAPAIPEGGLVASDTPGSTVTARFAGPLAGARQSDIVSSDPAVLVIHDGTRGSTVGGQHPTVTCGADVIPLASSIYGQGSPGVDGVPTKAPYCEWAYYPLPDGSSIPDGAEATFDAPAGWLVNASGAEPAAVGVPAISPGLVVPLSISGEKSLAIGYNVEGTGYTSSSRPFVDISSNINPGGGDDPEVPAVDADGNPTKLAQENVLYVLADPYSDTGGAGKGCYNFPAGQWRFLWDGLSQVTPYSLAGTTSISPVAIAPTGEADNEAVYDVRDSALFSPFVGVYFRTHAPVDPGTGSHVPDQDGTYPCDVTNLRILLPDSSDPSGDTPSHAPPKWYRPAMDQLGPAACLRAMNSTGINGSNAVEYAEFITPSRIGYSDVVVGPVAAISSVSPYAGADPYFRYGAGKLTIVCESPSPHGLVTGRRLNFRDVAIPTTAGSVDLTTQLLPCLVPDATSFVVQVNAPGELTGPFTPPPGATARALIGAGGITFQDTNALAAEKACDLWRNVPHLMSDAGVAAMAAHDAARWSAGRVLYVEYTNEPWNSSFAQWYHLSGMSASLLGTAFTPEPYQLYQSARVHATYSAAFAAAGIPARYLRRVIGTTPFALGTQTLADLIRAVPATYTVDGVTTTNTVDLAAGTNTTVTDGVTTVVHFPPSPPLVFDDFAASCYVSNDTFNAETQFEALAGGLDFRQLLDLLAIRVAAGQVGATVAAHRAILAAARIDAGFAFYEGSWDCLCPFQTEAGGPSQVPDQGAKIHAMQFSPYMRWPTFALFQQAQDAGVSLLNIFYANGGNSIGAWDTYMGLMVAGTGLEPGAANVSDPTDTPHVRSVVGGAINAWLAMAAPTPAAAASPGPPARPGPIAGTLPDGSFWLYAPAAGRYALEVVDGALEARPTGVRAADSVVVLSTQGLFRVAFVDRRSGARVAVASPLTADRASPARG